MTHHTLRVHKDLRLCCRRHPGPAARMFRLARSWSACLLLAAALASGACDRVDDSPPPTARIAGDAKAFGQVLERLTTLEGTPIAALAKEAQAKLSACAHFETEHAASELEPLLANLKCLEQRAGADGSAEAPPANGVSFRLPVATVLRGEKGPGRKHRGTVRGTLTVGENAAVDIDATFVPRGELDGVMRLLMPASGAVGESTFTAGAVMHGRVKSASDLDIAGLVPEGSQADDMFQLKSALFTGVVLDGTIEMAVYLPGGNGEFPPVALALGVKRPKLAVEAMEEFIVGLQKKWPVHRTPREIAGRPGVCLLDLNILPSFAPCYVTTENALAIGWNKAALELALSPERPRGNLPVDKSGAAIQLSALPEADSRLSLARYGEAAAAAAKARVYPWRRLELDGVEVKDGFRFRAKAIPHRDASAPPQ